MTAAALEVDAHVAGRVRAALTVASGERVALVGPNGSGKSTLVELVAGLVRPTAGHVRLGGRTVADAATWVPPHERHVGLLGQEPLLFDHLSVVENVAFGLRAQGVPRGRARAEAEGWLEAVGVPELVGVRRARLSGGQAARVALARALASRPQVLVLDEPSASLDVRAAAQVRHLLAGQERHATLLVSHDVLDVLTLADRVVVLEAGEVVDDAPTDLALTLPRSDFAAHFAGLGRVHGTAVAGGLRLADGTVLPGVATTVPSAAPVAGAEAWAVLAPTALRLVDGEGGPGDLPLVVDGVSPRGDHALVTGRLGDAAGARVSAWASLADAARLERAATNDLPDGALGRAWCRADPSGSTIYAR
ncbi:molybdate transport system ATP-binding protein [Flavimobilis soli]|uniref:Molybdate transport system ATP-binding protein n=1 Tax=Flavimobilis soli TaxID=442709 RepID=A0A2A9EET4_9MICO|nr:ATP-binding cassette domain-containing protein [Flavimobilis soli]PFG36782.1 molybdate transport system ATP-binding protein [Flavimobilis soli]